MGRSPCCSKEGLNKGAWTAMEDQILTSYIQVHGEGNWRNLPKRAGLKRCGKSCRLRWLNYLRPGIKRGNISQDEEELIVRLHKLLGNRWSLIAGRLPGRTDNEIKNYWNTTLGKKAKAQSSSSKSKVSPPSKPTVPQDSLEAAAKDKIHVIRTKAARCTKSMVPSPHLPSAYDDQILDTAKSTTTDPLEPQNNQSYLIDLVPSPHLPSAYDDQILDTAKSTTTDPLEPQDNQSYLIDKLHDQDLNVEQESAEGVNEMYGIYDSDLLNFGCNNVFEDSNFDAKVESAAAGYNDNISTDHDQYLLPINEVPIIDCWTPACFDDHATANLESLAFLLASEDWH